MWVPHWLQVVHYGAIGFFFSSRRRHTRWPRDWSSDVCSSDLDLDQVDTIDGDDYYFYDYRNKDVEAAVSVDDECYSFEAEEHSEDDMLEMSQSLKPIDEQFNDISINSMKFPTQFLCEIQ